MSTETQNNAAREYAGNKTFAPALLDPDLDIPQGVIGPDGNPAPKRFSVYRNNVVVSLMEAMAQTYPAILKITGEEIFATLTRSFISAHPPKSAMMQAYGAEFAEFLAEFKPLQQYPFLIDVAKLEQCWIDAYHAADAAPLDGAMLGKIDPQQLMTTKFVSHPATHIIKSNYALHDLFASRDTEGEAELDFDRQKSTQSVLITRPHLAVEVNGLDYPMTEFFQSLIDGQNLEQSVEKAMVAGEAVENKFDASSAITLMLTTGTMTAISNSN